MTAAAGTARASLPHLEFYRGRRVMITGGVGFIGSNLARQLVSLGAQVLLIDSLIPDYGGNLFNIHDITDVVRREHVRPEPRGMSAEAVPPLPRDRA